MRAQIYLQPHIHTYMSAERARESVGFGLLYVQSKCSVYTISVYYVGKCTHEARDGIKLSARRARDVSLNELYNVRTQARKLRNAADEWGRKLARDYG